MSSRNGSCAGSVDEGVREGAHVVEMQRRRLLGAIVELVHDRGALGLTVAMICGRASLSRRTFYELYEDREACLLGAFEYEVEQATRIIEQAVAGDTLTQGAHGTRGAHGWKERIRVGLRALLSFFDSDPGATRLLVVEALSAGEQTLQGRRRVLGQLVAIVDEGRTEAKRGRELPPLTAEGVVGAVSSVIHARILDRDQRPLTELTGALMAMIVQPYLGSAAARRELERPLEVEQHPVSVQRLHADPFKDLPMRLTYRTVRVLSSIAEAPGASNKQVARAAGITDEGQTSKLLTRLHKYELIQDTGIGPAKGMPRAWSLTERGEGLLQAVGQG
jgi:AcrR family transcriptional regulator/DNA-binding MarR family transcriptional regulator